MLWLPEKEFPNIEGKKFYLQPFSLASKYAFNIDDNDFKEASKERQSVTKEKMAKKYGQEEGLKRWESYCSKQALTNTYNYKKERYGWSEEQFKAYNKKRACTLANFIERHGQEEGSAKWKEYCDKQRQSNTLEYFIEKHGKEVGKEKFEAYNKQRIAFIGASKKADEFCEKLAKHFEGNAIYSHFNGGEFQVAGYSTDYYDADLNIAIEFYGDLWHCNPIRFSSDDIIPSVMKMHNCKFAKDIWIKDKEREECIKKKLGCKFYIVWESEYDKNPNECINALADKIKSEN